MAGAYNDPIINWYDVFILRFYKLFAAFTASDDTICKEYSVSFTDQSSDYVISWEWTFEGGTPGTSTAQNPTVTYNDLGTYDVQLIVSDGISSDTLLKEDFINVIMAPAPAISGPANVCSGFTEDYLTVQNPGNTYDWEVSGGTVITGAGTYKISVEWGAPGSGYVMVTEDNGTCSATTEQYRITIDECTAIRDNDLQNFNIYPNPPKNVLNIDLNTFREIKDGLIRLININGKVITSVRVSGGSGNIRISTSGYAPGLYYLQVIEQDRVIGVGKVVIGR